MDFNEKLKLTGHLEVIKIDNKTGEETVLFDDHNVITSGLGQSIAQFMTASGCYNLTPSTSSCLPDFQRYGPRPSIVPEGTENQLRESSDWSESFTTAATRESSKYDEYCCMGDVYILGYIKFTPINATSMSYAGTIEVITRSNCTGWECGSPLCEDYVQFVGGNDTPQTEYNKKTGVAYIELRDAKVLGCCEDPHCPWGHGTATYSVAGVVAGDGPNEPAMQAVARQLANQYSLGGILKEPIFEECCPKRDGDGSGRGSSTGSGVNI